MFALNLLFAASAAIGVSAQSFDINAIPSVCDQRCEQYKFVFSECPSNDARCTGICNGTALTGLQVCVECLVANPDKVNLPMLHLFDAAQQQLAQKCVEAQYPATYTGEFSKPTTIVYPNGVHNATIAGPSPTAAANQTQTTAAPNATSSAPSQNGTAAPTGGAPSDKPSSANSRAGVALAAVLGAVAAATLL